MVLNKKYFGFFLVSYIAIQKKKCTFEQFLQGRLNEPRQKLVVTVKMKNITPKTFFILVLFGLLCTKTDSPIVKYYLRAIFIIKKINLKNVCYEHLRIKDLIRK